MPNSKHKGRDHRYRLHRLRPSLNLVRPTASRRQTGGRSRRPLCGCSPSRAEPDGGLSGFLKPDLASAELAAAQVGGRCYVSAD